MPILPMIILLVVVVVDMGEEVVLPFAYVDLCQLAAAHKVQMTAASSAASWLPTYSGAYPFSPLLIFSIVGKVNTFFLNSPLLAQLFLIHARFRHDRLPQYLTSHHIIPVPDAIGIHQWYQESEPHFSFPKTVIL